MATPQTNMTVKPLAMLLRQINLDNNVALTEEQVQLRSLTVLNPPVAGTATIGDQTYPISRNTSVELDILTDEVQDDFVTLRYQRIALDHLFSRITPSLFELDVLKEGELSPADVWNALLAKYEILGNDTDFTLTANADKTQLTLAANDANFAYIGTVVFIVDPSLVRRIPNKLLDGFEIPQPEPTVPDYAIDGIYSLTDAPIWYDLNDNLFIYASGTKITFVSKSTGAIVSKMDVPAYEGSQYLGRGIIEMGGKIYFIQYGAAYQYKLELIVYVVDIANPVAVCTMESSNTSDLAVNIQTASTALLTFSEVDGTIATVFTGKDSKHHLVRYSSSNKMISHSIVLPGLATTIVECYSAGAGKFIIIDNNYKYSYYEVATDTFKHSTKSWPSNDVALSTDLNFNIAISGTKVYHTTASLNSNVRHRLYVLDLATDTMEYINLSPIYTINGITPPTEGYSKCMIDGDTFRYINTYLKTTTCYSVPLSVLSTFPSTPV